MTDATSTAAEDAELRRLSEHLCAVAAEAATAVGDDLRAAFRSGFSTEWKRDRHDPVTEHDRRSEARIREVLAARTPDSTVIGEEQGGSADSAEVLWYVDPIDGTANFARGLAFWCVSVGAVVGGRPVAGAILDPTAGHLFTSHLGGAFLDGAPIASRGVPDEGHALLATSYPTDLDFARDRAGSAAHHADLVDAYSTVRRPGSAALELAHIAAGWADATMATTISGYDICAGQSLLLQAGGRYLTFDVADPDGASARAWDAPGYLATTADLDPVALVKTAEELLGGRGALTARGGGRG